MVFDIEILVVFPLASALFTVQSYGFWIFTIFFLVLTVGFVFEFGSGALYLTDKRSSITNVSIKSTETPFLYLNLASLLSIENLEYRINLICINLFLRIKQLLL